MGVTNPGTDPDHNIVTRRISGESSFKTISATLPPDATFDDYAIPAGKNVDYQIRAVDSGGATADSIVSTSSITLANDLRLHQVTKLNSSNNLTGSVLTLWSQGPHDRTFSLPVSTFETAGTAKPDVNLGQVEDRLWQFPVTITMANDATRLALRALFETKAMLCLRTPGGHRLFGALQDLAEIYRDKMTELVLRFLELDYDEAI